MDKFTAGLERAVADLVEGAIEISKKLMSGELEWRTKKAKAKAKRRTAPKVKRPGKPNPTRTVPVPSGGYVDVKVGDLWKRRDGDSARHVLAVDTEHVTVDSPKFANGTKVKLAEFVKRYKREG